MTSLSFQQQPATTPAFGWTVDVSEIPLFRGVDRAIASVITRDMLRVYRHDDVIYRTGELASHLFALKKGRVSVAVDGQLLTTHGVGDLIGAQAFVDRAPRGATVTAVGDVETVCIPHLIVERLLGDRAFSRNFLCVLSQQLNDAARDRAERYQHERLLFSEFRAHVSEEVAQRLLNSGLDYGKPRRIPAVILFSDIRNFTPRSAALDPEDIAMQLSDYFDEVVDMIHKHGGMVDKFIGDAVMAVWGFVPAPAEELATSAYSCARDMIVAASERAFAGAPLSIGVGLNAGEVFMGNVGGRGKRQFTVLGNPVNMAARFESASKSLGAPLALGESVAQTLSAHDQKSLRAFHGVPIKGAQPQTIYTWSPRDNRGRV
ncbi:MAG: adenylate/guanylate cyclase domain-containing protein [Gemmatimonadaceae bacterium]